MRVGCRIPRAAAAAIVLAACLAGCGPRGTLEPELFPLGAGLRWEYLVTTETPEGPRRERFWVENAGTRRFADGPDAAERRNSLGNSYYFVADSAGIYRIGVRNEIEDTPRWDEDKPRRYVLRAPIRKGTNWQMVSHPYLVRRTFEWPYELKFGRPIVMNYEIESVDEAVAVPAGRFEHCVLVVGSHVMKLYVDPTSGYAEIPITSREWYCPRVGMVKLVRDEPVGPSKFYSGGRVTFELVKGPA